MKCLTIVTQDVKLMNINQVRDWVNYVGLDNAIYHITEYSHYIVVGGSDEDYNATHVESDGNEWWVAVEETEFMRPVYKQVVQEMLRKMLGGLL